MNEVVDEAFQYYHTDLNELKDHSVIQKKVTEWGNSISPDFLLGLKIKQRQKEYWKRRVQRDFSPSLEMKKKRRQNDLEGFGQDLDIIKETDSSTGHFTNKY